MNVSWPRPTHFIELKVVPEGKSSAVLLREVTHLTYLTSHHVYSSSA